VLVHHLVPESLNFGFILLGGVAVVFAVIRFGNDNFAGDEAEFLEQIEVADGGKTASTGLSGAMPRELAIEMP